jgi:hypothetical protein
MARRNGIGLPLGRAFGIGAVVSPVAASAGAWTLDAGAGQAVVTPDVRLHDHGETRHARLPIGGAQEFVRHVGATDDLGTRPARLPQERDDGDRRCANPFSPSQSLLRGCGPQRMV